VSIVSPTNGQVLVYNSSTSKWENSSGGYVPYTGAVTTVNLGAQTIQAGSFVKAGGTSAQFLKADGSVDSNTYLTTGSASATYVPYTGATADVNLGTHDLAAERGTFANNGSSDTLTVNHTSGSGYGIIVTKGGNNEALYVSKTSGSGNAMSVVGGRTSLVDLALSSVTNTAGDFLTLSGGVVHKRTAAQTLTDIGGQAALTNPVTGTGTTNYLAKFTGSTTVGNSQVFDNGTNVGIGTTSISGTYEKLAVAGGISIKDNTNAKLEIGRYNTTGAQNSYIKLGANSNSLRFTNNTDIADLMELTNLGNLGLGVTPSAGGLSGYVLFELANGGASIYSGPNQNLNGTNISWSGGTASYKISNFATLYNQQSGQHQWFNAPSGTAGNAISFTQAMTLTSGGNLLVGTTTDNGARLQVEHNGNSPLLISTSSTTLFTTYRSNSTVVGYIGNGDGIVTSGGATNFGIRAENDLIFTSGGNNRRLTITSGGNVGIGTNTPNANLEVYNASQGNIYISSALGNASALRFFSGGNEYVTLRNLANGNFDIETGTGSPATRMRITSGGNVLIGTTTDAGDKLQVNGAIKTSAPSGGTAGSWKFGTATSGIFTIGGKIRIEINGVAYDILTT
jgi:hypothetical protein